MKTQRINDPFLLASIFVIFFIIPVSAAFLPLNGYFQKWLAVIILLGASYWLYKREGSSLSAIGLDFRKKNLRYILPGLLIGILFFCSLLALQREYNDLTIPFNQQVNIPLVFAGLLYALPAVLMEELIFRGYCLQKTIERIGFTKANLLFAFLFIVWHWVAFNAWGNYGQMLSLFTTGFGHWFFAVALRKSGTLWLPIAIHLGNNWASRNIFGYQQSGDSANLLDSVFYIRNSGQQYSTTHNIVSHLLTFACFLLFIWLIGLWYKKKATA
jgi:membrane protease YdiL (CAAX protease family)